MDLNKITDGTDVPLHSSTGPGVELCNSKISET